MRRRENHRGPPSPGARPARGQRLAPGREEAPASTKARADRRRDRGLGKAEQAAETRATLLAVGRRLFCERSFAGTSTEAILVAAEVTRGALYYHFKDKAALLRAVCDELYAEIGERVEARAAAAATAHDGLVAGCEAFLALAGDPAVVGLLFLDAPAVLGRDAWGEIEQRHGASSLRQGIEAAMAEGAVARQPTEPLTAVLNGALNEAVLWASRQPDRTRATADVTRVVNHLLGALRAAACGPTQSSET